MNFFRRIHSGHVVVAVLRALVCDGSVFGAVACSVRWAAEPSGRPNVLFIAVDDLRPELHCYGMTDMHTPNIDRLAASGVLFERHYVQFAVCIPSRVALLTSLRSERTHQVYGPPVWEKIQVRPAAWQNLRRGRLRHGVAGQGLARRGPCLGHV